MTVTKARVILCSKCGQLHSKPDCSEREMLKGPAGYAPLPLGGCIACHYGWLEVGHTYDGQCDRGAVPLSNVKTRQTFWFEQNAV